MESFRNKLVEMGACAGALIWIDNARLTSMAQAYEACDRWDWASWLVMNALPNEETDQVLSEIIAIAAKHGLCESGIDECRYVQDDEDWGAVIDSIVESENCSECNVDIRELNKVLLEYLRSAVPLTELQNLIGA